MASAIDSNSKVVSAETPASSSSSSYSSADSTPKKSPQNKLSKHKSTVTDMNEGQSKRSSSDGAMLIVKDSTQRGNSLEDKRHQRSRSDCDDLIQSTKSRMQEKFAQLEQESGLKLKSTIESSKAKNDEEPEELTTCVDHIRSISFAEVKEQAYSRMQSELNRALNELKLRDEEVAKLSRIREEVESELEDLTASLFEEANHMVYDANVLRAKAQKELYEANLKIEVLQAEVQALKMLVLTSTPSNHSSVRANGVKSGKPKGNSVTKKSPSNYELGDASDKFDSMAPKKIPNGQSDNIAADGLAHSEEYGEVDPVFHQEFLEWKKNPNFDPIISDFIKRIYDEEIYPVFNFKDKELTADVLRAIEDNTLIIEAVSDKSPFPKRCALLDAPRSCKYRMKIGDNWYNISELCRNRIIAVCDLFCYLRYIERGLVKSSFHEVYWQVMRRRRNIALSRLGFSHS